MLCKRKHTVCILQLASRFISFHHHRVPLYKYTAVCLGILLLAAVWLFSVWWIALLGTILHASPAQEQEPQCVYATEGFWRHRLQTQSTCLGKAKLFQSQSPSSTPTSTDEHSCCFTIAPILGIVQHFCQPNGYEIHSHCGFNLQLPDY